MHHTARSGARACALAAALASAALLPGSAAARFDEGTGTVSLEGATIAWDLDSLASVPAGLAVTTKNADGNALEASVVGPRFAAEGMGIEGLAGLWLGGKGFVERLSFTFAAPEALRERRIEVSFWARPRGVMAAGGLAWSLSSGATSRSLGATQFLPTGRMTDDGWRELSTGPVDFALGGKVLPTLSIQVERKFGSDGEEVSDPGALVLIDALTVTDLGPRVVAPSACNLTTEASACGALGACHFGRCVDAASVYGALLAEGLRKEVVDRRSFEARHFFGNRASTLYLPEYQAEMELARAATSPRIYWEKIYRAYEILADAHGSPPTPLMTTRPGVGMCVHQGHADLVPNPRSLPLVFYADPASPFGALVLPGDALESVDGVPLDAWLSFAGPWLMHYGSPGSRALDIAPKIPALALRKGSSLGFSRCASPGAACTTVTVDFNALFGKALWEADDFSAWKSDPFACDFRFRRLSSTTPKGGYTHAAAGDDGDVRMLEINGVPDPTWSAQWDNVVSNAWTPTASSLYLLDQRTGYGGTINGTDLVTAAFLDPANPIVSEFVPVTGPVFDGAIRDRFLACAQQSTMIFGCGNFHTFASGDSTANRGTLSTARIAVLNGFDVSGNDWTTKLFKMRGGSTRIFGPANSLGGFGSVYDLPSYLGEITGGSAQMSDSLIYQGAPATPLAFESGPGIEPDEVVSQTQSDLVAGKDTLIERAKAWLHQ